jgi:sulfur carrier protein
VINGERQSVPIGTTIVDLLRRINVDPLYAPGIAVSVNDEVIHREDWENATVNADDRVEVISARQGG